ncbi:hypothetical protein I4U23_010821 [Adineta vaga]|nr:hypothetical protein I4U23_010821 [Adineta vaga]
MLVNHKVLYLRKKVHHRLISLRNNYLHTSDEDEFDLPNRKNCQSTNVETNNEKQVSSSINPENDIIFIDEHSNKSSYTTDQIPDGVTHSSIEIVPNVDKSISTSVLSFSTNKDLFRSSTSSGCSNKNEYNGSSYKSFDTIVGENLPLKEEINYYKSHWRPKHSRSKPNVSSKYTQTIDNDPMNIEDQKITKICRRLKMSNKQLKECKHDTDITKTCRLITKFLYPDIRVQARMSIKKMSS